MPELRLPYLTRTEDAVRWAQDLILQLRRQFSPVLRRLAPLSPFGLQALDGAGTVFSLPWLKVDSTILNVATTLTATALVRPGLCFGVFAQNQIAVAGTLTSYQIGTTTPADLDAWGATHVKTVQTEEGASTWMRVEDFVAGVNDLPRLYQAATNIVLTPNGGTFTSGQVRLIAFSLDFKPTA